MTDSAGATYVVPLSGTGATITTALDLYAPAGSSYYQGRYSYDPSNADITAKLDDYTGNQLNVTVTKRGGDYQRWDLHFTPTAYEKFVPGKTYTVKSGTSAPWLSASGEGPGPQTAAGSFTVQDAVYRTNELLRFSATFRVGSSSKPALLGTFAWRSDKAQPLPGIVGFAPEAVADLHATVGTDWVKLAWIKPITPDWKEVIVRRATGATAPATEKSGTAVYTGRASSATAKGLKADGTRYSFSVFVRDTEGKVSRAATLKVGGSKVTIRVNKTLGWSREAVVFGTLTDAATGKPMQAGRVEILGRASGTSTWKHIADPYVDGDGNFSANTPALYKDYEFVAVHKGGSKYSGEPNYLGDRSSTAKVTMTMYVAAAQDRYDGPSGTTFHIATAVGPDAGGKKVELQEKVGGKWRTIQTKTLLKDKATEFSLRPGRGTHTYRVWKSGQGSLDAGTSADLSIRVY
jgi:hypothetical protein